MMAAASMMMSQNAAIHREINEDNKRHKKSYKSSNHITNDGFSPSPESFKAGSYSKVVLLQALEQLNYKSLK